jgi:aspartyl-tRNA(Asn)/glutamyl-tRNA(Gln) amidotransferase subunit A
VITEDLLFSSVRRLGTLIRSRKTSSLELTQAYLDRLETLGPKLGALVTLTRDLALSQARRADEELLKGHDRGPLHGIPYGAKDLLATRGIPTTWGAEPYRHQMFDFNATVIERLEAAGAVLTAKLAMVELAGGMGYNNPDASFTGPGRTPWNTEYWSGGSSSGSGAAVAAGLVAFAIGSETSGSILTPAAFCGVTGLRPTYGLVSRHGAMALCFTLDKLGPLCRTADDCGLVLGAIAGPDPKDPTTGPTFTDHPDVRGAGRFRIGVLKRATERADPEVKANFEASLDVLKRFATLERDVEFPDLPYDSTVELIVSAEGAAAFRDLIEGGGTRALRAEADRIGGYAMIMTLAVDYLEALRARVPIETALSGLLTRFDAVVAPTRQGVAPPIGYDFDKPPEPQPSPSPGATERPHAPSTISGGNLAGLPALCVPNGLGRHGLPTSLQFLGAAHSEPVLLALGRAYQAATDFHSRHPPFPPAEGGP